MVAVLYGFQKYRRFRGRQTPVIQNLFRIPGQSLLRQLDELNQEINLHLVYVFTLPLITYAAILSSWVSAGVKPNEFIIATLAIICLAFIGYCIFKIVKLMSRRRRIRLGYEGELAVRQELNQLEREGYGVYHDFQTESLTIDHIIVGSNGVFTVATQTRSKSKSKNTTANATVTYDGRGLYFPKVTDYETIEQAERQADWLSDWLTHAADEPLAVRAIVALPGWFVKRTSSDGIPVVNPKQFLSLFEHIKPRYLSESMLTRIHHQIEQKCRDIEPLSDEIENNTTAEGAFST